MKERAMREQMEKEESEQAIKAQEEADLEMAMRIQEEAEVDLGREKAEPDSNPLLPPRDER